MDKSNAVLILSCGGTIDKVYFDAHSEYEVGEPQIEVIFRQSRVAFEYQIESLFRKDSLEMTDADRQQIRQRVAEAEQRRILITHGTDTMADTAEVLRDMTGKVVVLTGSMMPARFSATDAEFNIGCAVGALQSQSPGVYVAMNGCVFAAGSVRKNRQAGRFESQ